MAAAGTCAVAVVWVEDVVWVEEVVCVEEIVCVKEIVCAEAGRVGAGDDAGDVEETLAVDGG